MKNPKYSQQPDNNKDNQHQPEYVTFLPGADSYRLRVTMTKRPESVTLCYAGLAPLKLQRRRSKQLIN